MPNVPTFREAGYKGFEAIGWIGALFPAGVPADRVASASAELVRITKDPVIQRRLREYNLDPTGIPAEEFGKILASDMQSWGDLIRELNIKDE